MLLLTLVSIWLQLVSAQLIPCNATQHLADSERVFIFRVHNSASLPDIAPRECPQWVNNGREWQHSIKKKHCFSVCSEIREEDVNFLTKPNKDNSKSTLVFHTGNIIKQNHTLFHSHLSKLWKKRCQNAFFPLITRETHPSTYYAPSKMTLQTSLQLQCNSNYSAT